MCHLWSKPCKVHMLWSFRGLSVDDLELQSHGWYTRSQPSIMDRGLTDLYRLTAPPSSSEYSRKISVISINLQEHGTARHGPRQFSTGYGHSVWSCTGPHIAVFSCSSAGVSGKWVGAYLHRTGKEDPRARSQFFDVEVHGAARSRAHRLGFSFPAGGILQISWDDDGAADARLQP